MNKDQAKGRVEAVKGEVKEFFGVLRNDKGQEMKGKVRKNLGIAQAAYGDAKEDAKKSI